MSETVCSQKRLTADLYTYFKKVESYDKKKPQEYLKAE